MAPQHKQDKEEAIIKIQRIPIHPELNNISLSVIFVRILPVKRDLQNETSKATKTDKDQTLI